MLSMMAASLLAMKMHPNEIVRAFPSSKKLILETYVPKQFGEWHLVEMSGHIVNPQVEQAINKIYAQTLSRTYVDNNGNMIMLSIAYGENQSDSVSLHAPEGCYGGQGFTIDSLARDVYQIDDVNFPVMRMLARKLRRVEPVTYWMRIGEKVVYPGKATKIQKIKYGLQGKIPDGLLFRVSTVSPSTSDEHIRQSYDIEDKFINDLIHTMAVQDRAYLVGLLSPSG